MAINTVYKPNFPPTLQDLLVQGCLEYIRENTPENKLDFGKGLRIAITEESYAQLAYEDYLPRRITIRPILRDANYGDLRKIDAILPQNIECDEQSKIFIDARINVNPEDRIFQEKPRAMVGGALVQSIELHFPDMDLTNYLNIQTSPQGICCRVGGRIIHALKSTLWINSRNSHYKDDIRSKLEKRGFEKFKLLTHGGQTPNKLSESKLENSRLIGEFIGAIDKAAAAQAVREDIERLDTSVHGYAKKFDIQRTELRRVLAAEANGDTVVKVLTAAGFSLRSQLFKPDDSVPS